MSSKKTTIDGLFPERLRELIEKKLGVTQGEFAKKIGITTGYVSMVVTGKRGPSAEMIAGIFVNYGEYLPWLLNQQGPDSEKAGEGPKRLGEGCEMNPLLTDVNEWLNEEEKHKDAEFRILFRQQMIRAFFDYEDWVKKRKMSLGSGESGSARKVA